MNVPLQQRNGERPRVNFYPSKAVQFDKNSERSGSPLPKTEQQKSRKDSWYLGGTENRRGRNETDGLGKDYKAQSTFADIIGKRLSFLLSTA